jgi:trans-feruloyl-CoA hydratase/vanillin synthase
VLRIEDTSDGIRCIALDRAAKRNAIGVELTLAMEEILLKTRQDASVRAIVFHAIGPHFSAGMDMKDFFESSDRAPDLLQRARAATDHWRTHLLRQMPQQIVTAVRGYCFGGALPILQCSDKVVAASDAQFGLPEINFGMAPGAQIVKSVSAAMGRRGAAYAALTGRNVSAARAKTWGLVSEVVPGDPLPRALELARELAGSRGTPPSTASPEREQRP